MATPVGGRCQTHPPTKPESCAATKAEGGEEGRDVCPSTIKRVQRESIGQKPEGPRTEGGGRAPGAKQRATS